MSIKKIINLKKNKKYSSRVYSFENELHFDNWFKLMTNKGYKIIGIYEK